MGRRKGRVGFAHGFSPCLLCTVVVKPRDYRTLMCVTDTTSGPSGHHLVSSNTLYSTAAMHP